MASDSAQAVLEAVDDLRSHCTQICEPIGVRTGGCEILTAPPNSQGLLLLETLAALAELGSGDYLGADAGVLGELFRLAAADRDRHLGDPRFSRLPVDELLSREHAAGLAATARDSRAAAIQTEGFSGTSSGDTIALVTADASERGAVCQREPKAPARPSWTPPAASSTTTGVPSSRSIRTPPTCWRAESGPRIR